MAQAWQATPGLSQLSTDLTWQVLAEIPEVPRHIPRVIQAPGLVHAPTQLVTATGTRPSLVSVNVAPAPKVGMPPQPVAVTAGPVPSVEAPIQPAAANLAPALHAQVPTQPAVVTMAPTLNVQMPTPATVVDVAQAYEVKSDCVSLASLVGSSTVRATAASVLSAPASTSSVATSVITSVQGTAGHSALIVGSTATVEVVPAARGAASISTSAASATPVVIVKQAEPVKPYNGI